MAAHPSAPQLNFLSWRILDEALQDVVSPAAHDALDPGQQHTLQQTAQVAAALQQLGGCTDGEEPPARFTGSGSGPLGVSAADLLADGLPSKAARRAALAAALPLLEAGLLRRCRLMATASGYATSDYAGLPDHLRRLSAAAATSAAAQPEAWRRALEAAAQVVEALADASRQLCSILEQHKLTHHKAADEAQAAWLRSQGGMLAAKLRLVELQLQEATYTQPVVGSLRQVAAEVAQTTGATAARLEQASQRLRSYQALGPGFERLAREHAGLVGAVEEAEYELRELEQFRQLAAVTG